MKKDPSTDAAEQATVTLTADEASRALDWYYSGEPVTPWDDLDRALARRLQDVAEVRS